MDVNYLGQLLKKKGLKMTKQRGVILEVLSEQPGSHYTAEEIYELVRVRYPEIGIATVYRTLALLAQLELIDTLDLEDGQLRYEFMAEDEEGHHHHHLICNHCGKVFEFQEDLLETLEERIKNRTGFVITNHRVKMYGYCRECQKQMEGE